MPHENVVNYLVISSWESAEMFEHIAVCSNCLLRHGKPSAFSDVLWAGINT
jgi:hypothetical protein